MYTIATGTLIMIYMLTLTFSIICLVAQWKLFQKAGRKGWEILIPFYNEWVLFKITGLNWWYFVISIVAGLLVYTKNLVIILLILAVEYYIIFARYYNIAKKAKQNPILYGLLAIFVPYVPILVLGLSKNITYDNNIKVSEHGPFGNKQTK